MASKETLSKGNQQNVGRDCLIESNARARQDKWSKRNFQAPKDSSDDTKHICRLSYVRFSAVSRT